MSKRHDSINPSHFRSLRFGLLAASLLLHACGSTGPSLDLSADNEQQRIAQLGDAIKALDHSIETAEARRAARIAIEYSRDLAQQYEIADSPLMHNLKVQLGLKPRGLCIHWTEDLRARLRQEKFRSLDLHWAIANYEAAFRLEHSSVVISAAGAAIEQGLVLDPWRDSGHLYWTPTLADADYGWKPRADIHALKRKHYAEAANRHLMR